MGQGIKTRPMLLHIAVCMAGNHLHEYWDTDSPLPVLRSSAARIKIKKNKPHTVLFDLSWHY